MAIDLRCFAEINVNLENESCFFYLLRQNLYIRTLRFVT
jgi:hypothetical protein